MAKLNFFLFGISLLLANTHVHAGGMLRGRNLEESSSTPTCEEVDANPNPLFCREECGVDYWQCVNGEVVTQPMPEGAFCRDGNFADAGICTERDPRCDQIEALNQADKLMCTSDCSDTFFTCSNGKVISMPMAEGTRCYKNGIAHIDEAQCIIEEESITYFELLDACMNYPDLEHCASSADPSSPPYKGAELEDGAWYFVDKVWYSYTSTYSRENGKGWDININIRFGHDQEVGRSRSIVASMDHEGNEILKWTQYDLIDGDQEGIHYNCLSDLPEEPTTHFVEQLIKNPAIIFKLGEGQFDILDDDDVHEYTAKVMVNASELGEGFEGEEGEVEILVESEDAATGETADDEEPVVTPTFLFRNLKVYEDHSAIDEDDNEGNEGLEGFDDIEDDVEEIEEDLDMSLEEIRPLFDVYFNATFNETVCSKHYEPTHLDEPNTIVRVLSRGHITAGTGEADDGSGETIEDGTEEMSDQIDPIVRKLMHLTKNRKLEEITIPRDTFSDCKDGEVLVNHCCQDDTHFLACSPSQDGEECPLGFESSSRCVEIESVDDVIIEPHFLKGNIPMQLHIADHLERLERNPDHILTEPEPIDQSGRQLYWHDLDEFKWVHKSEEKFTSAVRLPPQIKAELNKITKWTDNSRADDSSDEESSTELAISEETQEELWDEFGDIFIGRGGGLPNVKDLLKDLGELDETLATFYEFTTDLEGDMLTVFQLMHAVDKADEKLKDIDRTLKTLHRVLKLVQIIKYVKPIAKPIQMTIERTRKSGILPALSKIKKVRDSVTKKYKPKVQRVMTKNEKVRDVLAKSRFLNQNLMINPFNTTRNCGPSDDAAKAISSAVDYAKVDTDWVYHELGDFKIAMKELVGDLSGVTHLVDEVVEALKKIADVTNPISGVMNPFYKALSTRITIPITGPFCSYRKRIPIRYPCGIKRCRRCIRVFRRKRCRSFPCGVKRCTKWRTMRFPKFCRKKFSFTINEVLNGISGVMDIVFYPINKAVDELLKAIPIPPIPLLPDFPIDLKAFDLMFDIGLTFDGPKFPTHLLDFPDVNLALPGLEDIVCGKSAGDLLDVYQKSEDGDLTPDYIRDFYNGCGGWQDLNPICEDTRELLCGDGGCPTESPTTYPTATHTASPTEIPSQSPTELPSISPSGIPSLSPTASLTEIQSTSPSGIPSLSPTESPTEVHSISPSGILTISPTQSPSANPSGIITADPTGSSTEAHTEAQADGSISV